MKVISISLTKDEAERMDALAAFLGMSRSNTVRYLIAMAQNRLKLEQDQDDEKQAVS